MADRRIPLNRSVHLDVRVVRIGLLGYGRIGQAIAQVIESERDRLAEAGVELRCMSALVRDLTKARFGPAIRLAIDPAGVIRNDVDVIVEVLGGVEPARTLVAGALRSGVPVVTANKTLMATHGQELRALAERHQTTLAFDAAVLAGVPFLGSLSRRPLFSAARRIAGVVNGTSHFIVGTIARGISYEDALADASARGYTEPDSSADTSGRDAAEKLTILLHLAGYRDLTVADLRCTGLEVLEPSDFTGAAQLGGTIKPVAVAALDPNAPGAWVGPAFVPLDHPFARIDGVTNALQLTSAQGREVLFAGPGSGPEVTAATVIDDVVEAVRGGFANAPLPSGRLVPRVAAAALREPAACSWYLRINNQAARLRPDDAIAKLTTLGLRATRIVEHGDRLAVLTEKATWLAIRRAVAAFEGPLAALPVI